MPSTGTPSANTSGLSVGAFFSYTEAGPPERMIPLTFGSTTAASGAVQGRISQYTFASRTRRAMSCVTWEPKSRMMTLSCIGGVRGSGFGVRSSDNAERRTPNSERSFRPIIRRFLGDGHVVRVALAQARGRHAAEHRVL